MPAYLFDEDDNLQLSDAPTELNIKPEAARLPTPAEQDKISDIKIRAISGKGFPFLAYFLLRAPIYMVDNLGTDGLGDGGEIYIDPELLMNWTPAQTVTELGGLVYRWLRRHGMRGKTADDKEAWLTASAWETNDDMLSEGYEFPEGRDTTAERDGPQELAADGIRMLPKAKNHGIIEDYYSLILREKPGDNSPSPDESGGGGSLPTGSGISGKKEDWETEGQEFSEQTQEFMRRKVAEDIKEAAEKSRGTMPAEWLREAEKILAPPPIPWQKYLKSAITRAVEYVRGVTDYSYARPNQAYMAGEDDILYPGLVEAIPKVTLVIDTSGSMSEKDLGMALALTNQLLKQLQASVEVITVDSAAHVQGSTWDVKSIKLRGGGGTDMRVGIDAARKESNIVLVFTDMETPWPDKPVQGKEVIAVGIVHGGRNNRWVQEPPPFIKTVWVDTTQR